MFGTKFTKEAFARGYQNAKSHVGNAYFRTKAFLGNVDHHVNLAKKVYAALHPALNHYAGAQRTNTLTNKVIGAVKGYDSIKNKVLNGHEVAGQHLKNALHVANAVSRILA